METNNGSFITKKLAMEKDINIYFINIFMKEKCSIGSSISILDFVFIK